MKALIAVLVGSFMLIACGGGDGDERDADADATTDPAAEADAGTDPGTDPWDDSGPYDCTPGEPSGPVHHVATDGSDETGDGSEGSPWATITHALDTVADGSTILVSPGLYEGRVRLRGSFDEGVVVRSAEPYRARLRHTETVVTAYTTSSGCHGITMEGFDIAHSGPGAGALVFHIDADGSGAVYDITLRGNVLHDSYDNDILKVNHGISGVVIERNLFYNQTGSDEHIDINSAADVIVQDNIFMSDFDGSGRTNGNDTSSYIVIKDSNQGDDIYTGSHHIVVRRNIFLNYEGSTGTGFLLLGEDGHPIHESHDILVENNLMIGNSANAMRAPFGVKGGRDIVFRANTVVGDMPGRAFAMRLNVEGDNPDNENISFFNNIWSDPTGTMGALDSSDANDFSDASPDHTTSFAIDGNLYWNGGDAVPEDGAELINYTDDAHAVTADPVLGDQSGLVPPRWDPSAGTFVDGSTSICEAFDRLVELYCVPGAGSGAIDAALAAQAPADDITGAARGGSPDIGACEAF
ncbi:MAG: hypothetical protein JRG91_01885 [Deltaproteobacteria bacterium]|nr:hypothetical protein [Deltaproteobacteria bacterium]